MGRIPRIAWLTPVDSETGLARYSALAVRALADTVDLTVWHPPYSGETVPFPEGTKLIEFTDPEQAARDIGEVDAVVYNIGNSDRYCCEVFEVYEQRPGIVVLHDKYLHDFLFDLFVERRREPERFIALMAYLYGDEGANAAADELQFGRRPSLEQFPLAGEVLYNAYGVLVHSAEGVRVASRYGALVPVRRVNMPLRDVPRPKPGASASRDNRLRITSTGRLDSRKQPERLIEAYANSALLREKAVLVFTGYADPAYVAELLRLARTKGIDHLVKITGGVSESELVRTLAQADICVNLRYPSTELASASLIEQFAFGRPVVANDIGFYQEPPADTMVRVSPTGSAAELRVALEKLVRNQSQRVALGERARQWALEACSDEQYRAGFLDLLGHVASTRPAVDSIDARGASALRAAAEGRQLQAIDELAKELSMGDSNRTRPAASEEAERTPAVEPPSERRTT